MEPAVADTSEGTNDQARAPVSALDVPEGSATGRPPSAWVPLAVRVGSHVVVWVALLVPMVVVLAHGWVPSGDDAAIAARSFQVLTLHPPLVGLVSTIGTTTGHYVSDPGPLLFWLLAVPVRLDPTHGALWGATVASGVILSVAIEALWRSGQWLAGVVVAFSVADYLWRAPAVVENIVWNAYLPIPFFIAAIVLAWVVAGGSVGWWPVLVLAGSVAAQSQLIFFLPMVVLVVTAPAVALLLGTRPTRLRWLLVGSIVAVGCWLAPLLQGLGPNGNVSALARSGDGLSRMGFGWGLRVLATAGSPAPLWLHSMPTRFFDVLGTIAVNGSVGGGVVLGLLVVIAAVAWRSGHVQLASLAMVAFLCSLAVAVGFGLVPLRNAVNLAYMIALLWALSVLVWSVVVWAVVLAAAAALRHLHGERARLGRRAPTWVPLLLVAPLAVLLFGGLALRSYQPGETNVGTSLGDSRVLPRIAAAVERGSPGRAVVLRVHEVGVPGLQSFWLTEGAAWALEAAGWAPGLDGMARAYTGLAPRPGSASYLVTVDPDQPTEPVHVEPLGNSHR